MALIANGPSTITRNVEATLYTAPANRLPGIFAGKIRPQGIPNNSIVEIRLYGKTTPNNTQDEEAMTIIDRDEDRMYLTPLEAVSFYRITATLKDKSGQSGGGSMSLDWEVTRSDAP